MLNETMILITNIATFLILNLNYIWEKLNWWKYFFMDYFIIKFYEFLFFHMFSLFHLYLCSLNRRNVSQFFYN